MFKRSYVVFRLVLVSSIFFFKAGFAVSDCRRTVRDMFQSENSEVISSTERKERILELVGENPKITQREMAKEPKLSRDTIKQSIKELKEEGRLLRIGSHNQRGYWHIPVEGQEYLDPKEERKERILELVSENSNIIYEEMAEKLELSIITISRMIQELKEEGRLLRIGSRRDGYWQIPEEGQQEYLDPKEGRKERILELVSENSKITKTEIARELKLSRDRIILSIKDLKEEGRLLRIGGRRDGYWQIPVEGEEYLDPKEERKERILELVGENQKITQREMAEKLELSIITISRMIQELKEEGRLLRRDGSRDGYWQIPVEGEEYLDPKEERKEKRKEKRKKKRKERILELVRENPKITQREMAKEPKLSRDTIKQSIKELKEEGRLLRIGSHNQRGYWHIPVEGQEYLDPKEERRERILELVSENSNIIYEEMAERTGAVYNYNKSNDTRVERGRTALTNR